MKKFRNMSLKELLSPYVEFEDWGDEKRYNSPLGIFENLCVVFAKIPEEILNFLHSPYDTRSWTFCEQCARYNGEPFLLYLNCSEVMNGYGSVKWEYFGTIKKIEEEILRTEEEIRFMRKVQEEKLTGQQ